MMQVLAGQREKARAKDAIDKESRLEWIDGLMVWKNNQGNGTNVESTH